MAERLVTNAVRMSLEQVHELTVALLLAQGFSSDHSDAIASTVTAAERDECPNHGLFRIPFYVHALRAGQASGDAEPTVTDLAPGIIKVDAHYGFSPLALGRSHAALAARAKQQGIAALAVNNALNIAALWPEVERLGEEGLVAFAFVASSPYVAPAGGTKPLFGTNPMAFAWPRANRSPLVFDQASSVRARAEIQLRLRDGKTLPDGWALDPEGKPTNDPREALAGAQLPFGGAKGSSIALMVELLAGPLLGDLLSIEAGERDIAKTGAPCGGELVVAIDPVRCVDGGNRAAQLEHGERLFAKILEQEGTRLPSDRRYEARIRTSREGIAIPKPLYDTLVSLRTGAYETPNVIYQGDKILRTHQARLAEGTIDKV
jgi:delta1-piperideine-2-carboxylate reductase